MRTLTAQDEALVTQPNGARQTWIKVEIERASGPLWGSETWVDLSNLNGFDWIISCEYQESIDSDAAGATVNFVRQIGDNPLFTLSPFIASSVNNIGGVLIKPYNKVRISTAVVPMGTLREDATFNVVFQGRIDDYTIDRNNVTIICRDRIGELQDILCEYERYRCCQLQECISTALCYLGDSKKRKPAATITNSKKQSTLGIDQ